MASLIRLPHTSDAFSQYRPSSNAHTDFIGSSQARDQKAGPQTIKLVFPAAASSSTSQEQLQILLSAIPPLLQGRATDRSFHDLSAICQRLTSTPHDQGQAIYRKVKEELDKSVSVLAREWRASIMGREGGWLQRLVNGWRSWETKVDLLSAVFVYLDRAYCAPLKVASIKDLAIESFRLGIWSNEILASKRKEELLGWVASERSSDQADVTLRPVVTSLAALSQVLGAFHTISEPYLESTGWHYSEVANANIESVEKGTMSASRYIEWALHSFDEELARATICFEGTQVAPTATSIVRTEAGEKQQTRIVRRAVDEAMDSTDQEQLARAYKFAVDCKIFPSFSSALEAHIKDRLTTLISNPENDSRMIEATVTLKRFADGAIRQLCEEQVWTYSSGRQVAYTAGTTARMQSELEEAVRVGMRAGMGSRQNAPAEWIAKHLDTVMRKGQVSGSYSECDEIVALIGFTKDKDIFKAFYSTQLAKRLLLNKSASDDMEQEMIWKLQKELGEDFTSGDVMMKDLALSETLVKSYQQAQAKNADEFRDPGNFTANVLTESAWPAYPLLKDGWNFKLTPELQTSIDQFTKWYATQHKNRQLSWRWQLATVSLTARFPSGKYEIGLSLFQAVTLLAFNEVDSMTFAELQSRTGIEQTELVRTVQSLAMGRKGTRVLVKKPVGKDVVPTDMIGWNKAFTSDRLKFKINQIQQDMSAEESRKTNEQVHIDRVSVLEATIVRIMKGKKKMTLQLLIDAVVTDVSKRFPPDVKEIKKRMESLIEREFLMRDEDDRNLLHYLA